MHNTILGTKDASLASENEKQKLLSVSLSCMLCSQFVVVHCWHWLDSQMVRS